MAEMILEGEQLPDHRRFCKELRSICFKSNEVHLEVSSKTVQDQICVLDGSLCNMDNHLERRQD